MVSPPCDGLPLLQCNSIWPHLQPDDAVAGNRLHQLERGGRAFWRRPEPHSDLVPAWGQHTAHRMPCRAPRPPATTGDLVVEGLEAEEALALAGDLLLDP